MTTYPTHEAATQPSSAAHAWSRVWRRSAWLRWGWPSAHSAGLLPLCPGLDCHCVLMMRVMPSHGQADGRPKPPQDKAYRLWPALGLLARREQSRRELKRKLGQKGYERDEADAALDRLEEQHYQDDERFAGMLVRNRAGQGYGPVRIRMELKTHGLEDAAIRAVAGRGRCRLGCQCGQPTAQTLWRQGPGGLCRAGETGAVPLASRLFRRHSKSGNPRRRG